MFQVKLKGNPTVYPSTFLELRIDGVKKYIETEKTLKDLITKYDVEEIEVYVKNKYYPLYNCYYKQQEMVWLVEGAEA
jgi:hypothetical protein